MKQISVYLTKELYAALVAYKKKHNLRSLNIAIVMLLAERLGVKLEVGEWGGDRKSGKGK